jgi:hypothetical protein
MFIEGTDAGMGSTPSGSHFLAPDIFYKHVTPLGLKKDVGQFGKSRITKLN